MPTKIGFNVLYCTGQDEQYRAADLNYHGPTVKGWRSAQYCTYPQEITVQLHSRAILHRIQILAHQYLIPQKIEIWTCEDLGYEPSISPSSEQAFAYLGFITLSDNQATGFKSRELKSVTIPPTIAKYIRFRLHTYHPNEKNVFGQVGLVAVSILGEEVPLHDNDDVNNNGQFDSLQSCDSTLISNPQYTSPYDDLAFEMSVDKEVAGIMRLMENKKHQAVIEERFEYARKLKLALTELRVAGETLGRYEQEKRQAINLEDYDKAKAKKQLIDEYRDRIYTSLHVEQLLEADGPIDENDLSNVTQSVASYNKRTPEPEQLYSRPESPEIQEEISVPPQQHITWSPHVTRRRTTSFSDYSAHRAVSPNQLCHSSSQSSFPMSSSTHQFRTAHSETPVQFQYHTPFNNYPTLSIFNQSADTSHSLPPIRPQEPFFLASQPESVSKLDSTTKSPPERAKSPTNSNASNQSRSPTNNYSKTNLIRGSIRRKSKGSTLLSKNSYEAYEERMLPALRHPPIHGTDVIRECQIAVEQTKKSKLNERERKQAALPITVFGQELVEKFYSKHFADKEEGLRLLQDQLNLYMQETIEQGNKSSQFSANKIARGAIFLLHRALRDKVYSVYSGAAEAIRFFFMEFVPGRVSSAEVGRSVEKLLPELISKSGDVTPRIHNMAAHTLLSMADCKEVRALHIIPVHLSRPLSSSVHPRLALSRLEMVEQLILNQGISTEKQSGLTSRTLAEFGSSGLHHPAEAVRKVSERILLQVYKVNPRLVRKQLPPDDDVTRRNLLYRQLFQEFDLMDIKRRREQQELEQSSIGKAATLPKPSKLPLHDRKSLAKETNNENRPSEIIKSTSDHSVHSKTSQIPKRTVNQQTSPMTPYIPSGFEVKDENQNRLNAVHQVKNPPNKIQGILQKTTSQQVEKSDQLLSRRNMARISEESSDIELVKEKEPDPVVLFPNLVDSVHVTETRMSQGRRSVRSVNALKYIFPTSYIGTSTTSQETVNKSNSTTSFSSVNSGLSHSYPSQMSGIPIPRNGFNSRSHNVFSSLLTAERFLTRKGANKAEATENKSLFNGADTGHSKNLAEIKDSPAPGLLSVDVADLPNEEDVEPENIKVRRCIFCSAKDDWSTEESLNMHYWKSCPMLTRCSSCEEVVEISGLTLHRLNDCAEKNKYQKCEKCQEAINKKEWDHHACKECLSTNPKTRCPFCHEDLLSEDAWPSHLMGDQACKNHPRKL